MPVVLVSVALPLVPLVPPLVVPLVPAPLDPPAPDPLEVSDPLVPKPEPWLPLVLGLVLVSMLLVPELELPGVVIVPEPFVIVPVS